jgi:tellurite resistance protein TerC
MIKTLQQAKRAIRIVIGFTVLLAGVAMTVLPGPAIVVIPAGLAILATEFLWARRLLERIKREASNAFNKTFRNIK